MNKNIQLLFVFIFNIFCISGMEEEQREQRGEKRPLAALMTGIAVKKRHQSYCPCDKTTATSASGLLSHLDKYHFNKEHQAIECPVDGCKKYFRAQSREVIQHLSRDHKLFIIDGEQKIAPPYVTNKNKHVAKKFCIQEELSPLYCSYQDIIIQDEHREESSWKDEELLDLLAGLKKLQAVKQPYGNEQRLDNDQEAATVPTAAQLFDEEKIIDDNIEREICSYMHEFDQVDVDCENAKQQSDDNDIFILKMTCPCGGTTTRRVQTMSKHMKKNHYNKEEKLFKCPLCKSLFKGVGGKFGLMSHLEHAHHYCSIINEYIFSYCKNELLKRELTYLLNFKNNTFCFCGNATGSTVKNLDIHLHENHFNNETKMYECYPQCGLTFDTAKKLRNHLQQDHQYFFVDSAKKLEYNRSTTQEKEYSHNVGKSSEKALKIFNYIQNYALENQIKLTCPCGKAKFTYKDCLLDHLKRCHYDTTKKAVICPIEHCGIPFERACDAANHLSDDHKLFSYDKRKLIPYYPSNNAIISSTNSFDNTIIEKEMVTENDMFLATQDEDTAMITSVINPYDLLDIDDQRYLASLDF